MKVGKLQSVWNQCVQPDASYLDRNHSYVLNITEAKKSLYCEYCVKNILFKLEERLSILLLNYDTLCLQQYWILIKATANFKNFSRH